MFERLKKLAAIERLKNVFKKTDWQQLAEEALARCEYAVEQNKMVLELATNLHIAKQRDHHNAMMYIAALIAAAGDHVTLSSDLVEMMAEYKGGVYYEKKQDGSLFLRLMSEEETQASLAPPECDADCDCEHDATCEALKDK